MVFWVLIYQLTWCHVKIVTPSDTCLLCITRETIVSTSMCICLSESKFTFSLVQPLSIFKTGRFSVMSINLCDGYHSHVCTQNVESYQWTFVMCGLLIELALLYKVSLVKGKNDYLFFIITITTQGMRIHWSYNLDEWFRLQDKWKFVLPWYISTTVLPWYISTTVTNHQSYIV